MSASLGSSCQASIEAILRNLTEVNRALENIEYFIKFGKERPLPVPILPKIDEKIHSDLEKGTPFDPSETINFTIITFSVMTVTVLAIAYSESIWNWLKATAIFRAVFGSGTSNTGGPRSPTFTKCAHGEAIRNSLTMTAGLADPGLSSCLDGKPITGGAEKTPKLRGRRGSGLQPQSLETMTTSINTNMTNSVGARLNNVNKGEILEINLNCSSSSEDGLSVFGRSGETPERSTSDRELLKSGALVA